MRQRQLNCQVYYYLSPAGCKSPAFIRRSQWFTGQASPQAVRWWTPIGDDSSRILSCMFPYSRSASAGVSNIVDCGPNRLQLLTPREFTQRRRLPQQERQKSNRFRQAKQQLCTCITLFCTFLCLRCTTATWNCLKILSRTETKDSNFLFLFLNFDAVL